MSQPTFTEFSNVVRNAAKEIEAKGLDTQGDGFVTVIDDFVNEQLDGVETLAGLNAAEMGVYWFALGEDGDMLHDANTVKV